MINSLDNYSQIKYVPCNHVVISTVCKLALVMNVETGALVGVEPKLLLTESGEHIFVIGPVIVKAVNSYNSIF